MGFASAMSGPWGLAAGAGLGAISGALQKKPMAYSPFSQMTDADQRKQYAHQTLSYLQGLGSGNTPLMSQAQINQQTSGARGRLAANQGAERMRINERALGRQGRMGGMAESEMASLGREGLGQQRQLEAGVQNTLASQAPGMRLQAAGMGLNFMGNQDQMAREEYGKQMQAAAARQQFSQWGNILAGGMAGLGAMGGMGGGGGQQGVPANAGGSGTGYGYGGAAQFSPSYGVAPDMGMYGAGWPSVNGY